MRTQFIPHAASTCVPNTPQLEAISSLKAQRKLQTMNSTQGFPISRLPGELQHEIYAHYFRCLPPIPITDKTLKTSTPSQLNTPLLQSSPFFGASIPLAIFYTNTTFSFSSPRTLQAFTQFGSYHLETRRVQISYGAIGKEGPDWVYALHSSLPRLESVIFIVDKQSLEAVGEEGFEAWWKCVEGAMREGVLAKRDGRAVLKRRGWGVLVTVQDEDGEIVVSESIGGLERRKMY